MEEKCKKKNTVVTTFISKRSNKMMKHVFRKGLKESYY